MLLIVSSSAWTNEEIKTELVAAREVLTQAFSSIPGVELLDVDIVPEYDFNVEELIQFDRWDYMDYLSPARDPAQLHD